MSKHVRLSHIIGKSAAWFWATLNPEGHDPYERDPRYWPVSGVKVSSQRTDVANESRRFGVTRDHLRYPMN